jgi:hypothetical protein
MRSLPGSAPTSSRYGPIGVGVREWLEQQAVAGFLGVENVEAEASERRYSLDPEYRPVFVDELDLHYMVGFLQCVIGMLRPIDALLDAYRSGAGVPYEAYGPDLVVGIAAGNRPQFHNLLAGWFGEIPEVDARLRAERAARVADVRCGLGWSSIAIAQAYPDAIVDALAAPGRRRSPRPRQVVRPTRRRRATVGAARRSRRVVHCRDRCAASPGCLVGSAGTAATAPPSERAIACI